MNDIHDPSERSDQPYNPGRRIALLGGAAGGSVLGENFLAHLMQQRGDHRMKAAIGRRRLLGASFARFPGNLKRTLKNRSADFVQKAALRRFLFALLANVLTVRTSDGWRHGGVV